MEHIFFELQLCIEILIFKEKSNFGYTDHPEIITSLSPYSYHIAPNILISQLITLSHDSKRKQVKSLH